MTSLSEAFPMVLLEAMSFGVVPICYSDLDGPIDIVDHEQNGFLVRRNDFHAISIRLHELASDTKLLRRLSHNAVTTSIGYTCDNVYPKICDMLEIASMPKNE
jgi:glycosyltransferase involved in cell wall biosynthesis